MNTVRASGKPKAGPGPASTPGSTSATSASGLYSGLWVENVPCIRLFPGGVYSGYFEVSEPARPPAPSPAPTPTTTLLPASSSTREDLVSQLEAASSQVRDLELRQIREQGDLLEPNAWLVRLGAPAHLSAFSGRKAYLRGLALLPRKGLDPREAPVPSTEAEDAERAREYRLLQAIFGAFDRVLFEGRTRIRPTTVSWQVLFELGRRDTNSEPRKPFYFFHRISTVRAYSEVYRRFFTYVFRTIGLPRSERPPYRPSEPILHAWDAVIEAATRFSASFPDYEFDAGKMLLPSQNSREEALFKALKRVSRPLLHFLIEVFREGLNRSEYDSILVSFLALLAIKANFTWEEP